MTDCSIVLLLKIWVTLPFSYMRRISESEVKEALKRIKSKKVIGLDGILIEVWRCLGEMDTRWLRNVFNKM